uniref:Uncharacterized protein n=1 Tax=Trypanosoma congolense (strain IL3000) TaxID=1068625 RepID=G0UVZ0_TRYCI|nr:conserved hypothetical protein [Trypanosoma congolense IL3000]
MQSAEALKLRRCSLIVLCSDSDATDIRLLSFILSKAASIVPPTGNTEAAQNTAVFLSPGFGSLHCDGHENKSSVVDELQEAAAKYLIARKNAASLANAAGANSGRGGKAKGGGKAQGAASSKAATTQPVAAADAVQKGQQAEGLSWYTVVQSSCESQPLVFVHTIPSLDRYDDEGATPLVLRQSSPAESVACLQKVLCMIIDEIDSKAAPLPRRASQLREFSLAGGSFEVRKDSLKEAPSEGSPRVDNKVTETAHIPMIVTIRDPRVLSLLLDGENNPSLFKLDVRLIVNFAEMIPSLSPPSQSNPIVTCSSSHRQRNPTGSKRQQAREVAVALSLNGVKDGDAGVSSGNPTGFAGVIERAVRRGCMTVVSSPADASHAYEALYLREEVECRGADKTHMIRRCLKSVLPVINHVVCDIAQYTSYVSPKTKVQCPVLDLPTNQERVRVPHAFSSALLTRDQSGLGRQSAVSSNCEPHFSSREWPRYTHERKVCGQWTCVSAVCALAAQATMSIAGKQEARYIKPVAKNKPLYLYDGNPGLLWSEVGNSPNELRCAGSRLPQSIQRYSEVDARLSCVDLPSEESDEEFVLDSTEQLTEATPRQQDNRSLSSARRERRKSSNPHQMSVATALIPREPPPPVVEKPYRGVMLPADHAMDRPAEEIDRVDVGKLTRIFVQRGIGNSGVVDSPTLPDRGADGALYAEKYLEEPLNGLLLEEAEGIIDARLMERVEEFFAKSDSILGVTWSKICEAAETSAEKEPFVEEKLRRSVERSLTPRERTHILQCFFLEMISSIAGINDRAADDSGTLNGANGSLSENYLCIASTDRPYRSARPLEEYISKDVAFRRLHDFISRFGEHLCRLVRCVVPDPLQTFSGNLSMLKSTNAENVHAQNRVVAVMLGGVVVPSQRHSRRVWCHYLSGVLSLNQFNELVASVPLTHASTISVPPSLSVSNDDTGRNVTASGRFGGELGDALRHQVFRNLLNTPQVVVSSVQRDAVGSILQSEGSIRTILEGRHAVYPHDNSVVEVVTTDRSRLCRYIKASELTCTLHYYVSPPNNSSAYGNARPERAPSCEAREDKSPSHPLSNVPAGRQADEELIYLTVAFDDGVVLTCSSRPRRGVPLHKPSAMNNEKDPAYSTNVSPRDGIQNGAKPPSRKGLPLASRERGNMATNALPKPHSGRRRTPRRCKSKEKISGESATHTKDASSESLQFPVDDNGSVLLWIHSKETKGLLNTNVNLPAVREVPEVGITVSANGVSVHNEEQEGILWLSRHDSAYHPVPELLQCVHKPEEDPVLRKSMEVEVRRAVLQDAGAVCRYFHSGATQMLYADGKIVTRYPIVDIGGDYSSWKDGTSRTIETIITPEGACYMRECCVDGDARGRLIPVGNLDSCEAYDHTNRCRTLSRSDGVIVVNYELCLPNEDKGADQAELPESGWKKQATRSEGYMQIDTEANSYRTETIASVVLFSDGTCITKFFSCSDSIPKEQIPQPLSPLFEQRTIVEAECGAPVLLCVEGLLLPRVFVCSPYSSVVSNPNSVSQRQTLFNCSENKEASVAPQDVNPLAKTTGMPEGIRPLARGEATASAPSVNEIPGGESSHIREVKPHDRFYILFGDGTVLRRCIVCRGMRGIVTPFLETVLARRSETSVRVLHEAGVAIVEPAEAVQHNRTSPASLAVGEGFPVFDIALGGLRLVDGRHHLTQVKNLYSSGAVIAGISKFTLEQLLRQLVLPMYTPHTVTKARREAMLREEIEAEEEDRRNRISGKCPPLANRLREIAEEFVVANNLLSTQGILKTANKKPDQGSGVLNSLYMTSKGTATPAWGQSTHLNTSTIHWKGTQNEERLKLDGGLGATENLQEGSSLPLSISPLFFSEMQHGSVVQYLLSRDVDNFARSQSSEPNPLFLSLSTCTGEPGAQQLTFLQVNEHSKACDVVACGVNALPGSRAGNNVNSGYPGMTSSSTYVRKVPDPNLTGSRVVSVMGSKIGEAVYQQQHLSAFSGTPLPFLTTHWLPGSLQPPRRFMEYYGNPARGTWKSIANASISPSDGCGRNVITVTAEGKEFGGLGDVNPSTQNLRMFLKFSDVTQIVQQLLLLDSSQQQRQLLSLVSYSKAMSPTCAYDEASLHSAETT